ncbi:BspA family leucine-rich repeat surface protein [Enterococcus hirae]
MNRMKYRVASIVLVSTMVVANICSFATFYAHADDDHTNVSQEQVQASNEQVKKDDALNIISNPSLTTDTQKITNSNSTESTSTSDTKLQNESTTSSTDIIEEKSDSESTEPLQNKQSTRASQDNVLIDGTWLTPAQGNIWLSNWDYNTRTAKDGTWYVRLNKYLGTSSSVVIPGIIPTKNGTRRVVINSLDQSSTNYLFSGKENLIRTVKIVDGQWKNKTYKVGVTGNTGCALAFRYANNLQTVDLSGLDFSTPTTDYTTQITNMSYMFQGCSNLTQVIFPNNGTNIISNADWMFLGCTSLNNTGLVNIANFFNTSLETTHGMFANTALTSAPNITMKNVRDLGSMFQGCRSLTSFDVTNLSNFRVLQVRTMSNMFSNCSQLKLINFSKIICQDALMTQSIDTTSMFNTSDIIPLIFIVPEDEFTPTSLKFDNYNFSGDHRTVSQYPMLNANGGTFAPSNQTTLNYFTSCAVRSTQLDMSTFNSWLNQQIPKKTGTTFLRWNTKTAAQTVLDLVNQQASYLAEWIQMPKTATDNRTLNTQEPLAIAYLPNVFTTGNQPIPLQNGGQQMVPFVKSTTFNIGIRDQRKSNTTWNLTAQLVGNSSNLPSDAYLQVGDQATVTLNINNGTAYNPLLDLQPVKNQNPVGNSNAKITTTPTTILSKNSSTELNGVYDLDLGNISLVLPNSQNVAVGNYSATVSWNLVTGP